jgi:chorismate mutase
MKFLIFFILPLVNSFHISFHEYYTVRLQELRNKVDLIDYKIYKLIDKRLEYSKQTKAFKLNEHVLQENKKSLIASKIYKN